MSTVKVRYRWRRGIGGRTPVSTLLIAMGALLAASCADSPTEMPYAEALSQVAQQVDGGHTWRAGASSTWHGYHAPTVTHEAAAEAAALTVCAEWSDDFLFTRQGGQYSGVDFFSFEIGWWVEGAGNWARTSVRNDAGTRRGCVAVPALEGDSLEVTVKGMARASASRPTSTHHTVTGHIGFRLSADPDDPGGDDPPGDPLQGTTVLYFADDAIGPDRILGGLQALVAADLIELTVAESRADLRARLESGPDVVVYFNQDGGFTDTDANALVAWIAQEGRLIYANWAHQFPGLMAALETASAVNGGGFNGNSLVFSDDALSDGVGQPMMLTNPGWGAFSYGLAATGSGVSVCTFNNGRSCMVRGNEGRTAMLGFTNDSVGQADGHNLIHNLLRLVMES